MARYCFYCGRELGPDETCTCRTTGSSGTSGSSGSSGPKASRSAPPPPPPRPKQTAPRRPGFFRSFFAGPPKGSRRGPQKGPTTPTGAFLRARLSEAGGFFVRPAQTVRRVATAATTGVAVLYIVLQAAVSAGAALAFSGRTGMEGFLAFLLTGGIQRTTSGTDLAGAGAPVAAAVFVSVLVQYLALAGILVLALRFLLRTPVAFGRILHAIAPAAFYGTVMTLLALVSSLGASIPATHLLLAGLVLGFVAIFIGLAAATGQSEDRVLALLLFTLFLYYAFLSILSGFLGTAFPAATVPEGTGGTL
jgi:hypothetical protein